ncbi:hypothetical protein F0562_016425 [Nyssa sinensis]|uniref:RRM domain-containing protein n=1 Tax=Nyssa sinensis TaxID=561372 RepID=A0A5J4ZNZ7_9ASTE|nr:hypothetical protein F0562_016425 [Nyssa sinensis]
MLGGMLENDVNNSLLGKREESDEVIEGAVPGSKDDEQVPSGKGKSVSHKRKNISGDVVYPSKKERRVSDLMSGSCTDLLNGESEPENKAGRKLTSSSGKKRKAVDSISDGSAVKSRNSVETSKPFLRIGETIRKVASQLALSTPIVNSKKSRGRKKFTPVEYLPPDEMLSQLCLIARDPMKEYSFLISIVSFLSDFRNSFCVKNANSQNQKKSTGEVSGEQTGKRSSNSETTETSGFEGMEDSYWTDRIIQSNTEEQVLFEPETPHENGAPTLEPAAALEPTPKSDSKQEASVVNHELEAGNLAGHMDDKFEQEYSPTALILNFTDLDSVPSETNLNKIFCRYGPLNERETEVLKKGNRAKVVFQRRSDAETAFSSAGKFSIFGPSLVSYRLNYSPTARKTPTSSTKGRRKDAAFLEGNAV